MSTEILPKGFRPDQVAGAKLHWIVALTYAGQTYYLAYDTLRLEADKTTFPGLITQLELNQGITLFTTSAEGISISLDTHLPIDVAAYIARGYPLSLATAEVALFLEGSSWAERVIVVKGAVLDPIYGAAGEPVSFTIEQKISLDTAIIPDAPLVVSLESWPDAADNAIGLLYPIVFGKPGYYSYPGGSGGVSGSPCRFVDTAGDRLLIAGHWVTASQVRISDGTAAEDFACINTLDALGQKVALVDITGAVVITVDPTLDYHAAWAENAGGLPSGAGDLLEAILAKSTVTYDIAKINNLKAALNAYVFAGYIDAAVAPFDWLQANLLPLLPVSLVAGADGLYGVLWEYATTLQPSSSLLALVEGAGGLERISRVTYQNSSFSTFKLDYGLRTRTGQYQTYQIRSYERNSSDSKQVQGYYCKLAAQRRNPKATKSLQSPIVYDGVTASKILTWLEKAYATDSRSVQYRCPLALGVQLRLGKIIRLTDQDISLTDQYAIVENLTITLTSVDFTLRLIDDPTVLLRGA